MAYEVDLFGRVRRSIEAAAGDTLRAGGASRPRPGRDADGTRLVEVQKENWSFGNGEMQYGAQ